MYRFVIAAGFAAGCAAVEPATPVVATAPPQVDIETARELTEHEVAQLDAVERMAEHVDRLILEERALGPLSPGTACGRELFLDRVEAADRAVQHLETVGLFENPEARRILVEQVIEPLGRLQQCRDARLALSD
ncbi:MAG: hypothetical protein GY711_08295 [bacterium]|nr:hypothetical protein [bacterium]